MRSRARLGRGLCAIAVLCGLTLLPAPGAAMAEGVPATPIPQNPSDVEAVPGFTGAPARPKRVFAPAVPQHPFMAPNVLSNVHDDAYQTNTYTWSAPLGNNMQVSSTFLGGECGSLTIDHHGRLVAVCIGVEGPKLLMFDAHTLELLAEMALPPRKSSGNPFNSFGGGGYFYLDQLDRAVIPTTTDQVWVVG